MSSCLFDSKIGQQALNRTIRVSLIVTVICLFAGYPVALFVARCAPRWRGLLLAVVIFPFLISAVVRAFGWTVLLGDSGLANKGLIALGLIDRPIALVQNEIGIIVGETHLLMPYMILSLLAVLQRIDPNLRHAAESLGASPVSVFWRIVIPLTLPGLLTGTLLVFSLAMTALRHALPARRRPHPDPDDAALRLRLHPVRLAAGGVDRDRPADPRHPVRHDPPLRVEPGDAQLWVTFSSARAAASLPRWRSSGWSSWSRRSSSRWPRPSPARPT